MTDDGCPVTHFDHSSPALVDDALWDEYRRLRELGPAVRSSAHGGFYVLARFADVKAALRDYESFANGYGHRVPQIGPPRAIPLDFDPPLHTEYRRIAGLALAPGRVRDLQPFLHELIRELVADFFAAGGGDAVTGIALPLPLRVLAKVVGFSAETTGRLRRLTVEMWEKVGDQDYDASRADIRALMDAEVARRRREPAGDFITEVLAERVGDRPIEDDEIARILMSLAIAGHETTMNSASSLLWLLASDEERQDRLRADPAIAPDYVEEMLRLRTPSQNIGRFTTRDVRVGDTAIPEHSRVLLSYGAANRDDTQFPHADQFDAGRATRGHLAFGFGIHQCLGAALARSELKILLETLCEYPPIRLAGPVPFGSLEGGQHLGPKVLPLRFTSHDDRS